MSAQRLVGSNSPVSGRVLKAVAGKRKCAHRGCRTLLSRYNTRDKCWAHANVDTVRNRARHKEPDEESA